MRLVTRADFDGLVCGAFITLVEEIDSYLFIEPKFMQDRMVEIRTGDIIANLPYHPKCSLWFDHHITNTDSWLLHIHFAAKEPESREARKPSSLPASQPPSIVPGKGGFSLAPSAARVVYEYYTTLEGDRRQTPPQGLADQPPAEAGSRPIQEGLRVLKSDRMKLLLHETDKIDAALLTPQEVLDPSGYVLISMTVDGKRAEDEPYWLRLIGLLRDAPLGEVLADPEVRRRCREILDAQETLKKILLERTTLKGNVIFVDLRGVGEIPDGNRFLLYTLFPAGNISLKIADDPQRPNTTAISVGYNIFNTTSKVNVGALMKKYGGGGHRVVGSCRMPAREADKAITEILQAIKE